MAPISDMFNKLISNSQSQHSPDADMCIDEMLVLFGGHCKFTIYMPLKPAEFFTSLSI